MRINFVLENAEISFNECNGRKLLKILVYREKFVPYRENMRFNSKTVRLSRSEILTLKT